MWRPTMLVALIAAVLSPLARAEPPAPIVAPSQWMATLARAYLAPRYESLAGEARDLAASAARVCASPGAEALQAARSDWKRTALSLRRVSPLPFGPVLESRMLRKIDFWPTRAAQIEASIVKFGAAEVRLDRVGVTAKGLPALEYLLFDPVRAGINEDAAACAYASWVARELSEAVAPVSKEWMNWADSLADAEPEVEKQLLVDGVNILIGSVEVLRTKFLEKPLQSSSPTPAFDAWRSGESVASMQASFDALRVGLLGRDVVPGLVAVLQGRGLLTLAEGLERLVGASARAFSTLPSDLGAADGRASAAKAATELAKLQYFLAEDVATKLKVAVGFGESDGD